MLSPSSVPRQMPVKLTTAPISVRPTVSAAISCAMSKSASWMRIVAVTDMGGSAAGHRRKERDFARAGDHRIRPDMGVVDRGTDHLRLLEGMGVTLVALGEPADQLIHRAHLGRRLDRLFRLADPFAHPGEIFQLHPSSSLMR